MLYLGSLSTPHSRRQLNCLVRARKRFNCWPTIHHWPYACCLQVKPGARYCNEQNRLILHVLALPHILVYVISIHVHILSAHCTYVDVLKGYHSNTLCNILATKTLISRHLTVFSRLLITSTNTISVRGWRSIIFIVMHFIHVRSNIVISKSKGLSEVFRDIRISKWGKNNSNHSSKMNM